MLEIIPSTIHDGYGARSQQITPCSTCSARISSHATGTYGPYRAHWRRRATAACGVRCIGRPPRVDHYARAGLPRTLRSLSPPRSRRIRCVQYIATHTYKYSMYGCAARMRHSIHACVCIQYIAAHTHKYSMYGCAARMRYTYAQYI